MHAPPEPEISLDPPRPVQGRPGTFTFVSRRAGALLHTDEFRPAVAARVTKFVRETVRKALPDVPESAWPPALVARLEARFAEWAVEPPRTAPVIADPADDPRADALARMPANVRAEAEELLADPRLIERISADIRVCGRNYLGRSSRCGIR